MITQPGAIVAKPSSPTVIKDLISIIIPTYNHAHFLGDAIQSALKQSYRTREIIVIDDGSTDHTRAVVDKFGERVRYLWQENRGLSGARNRGILAARGEYIALLDADDFWEPTYLERVHRVLANQPALGAVYTGLHFVNSKGERLTQHCVTTVPSDQLYDRLLDGEFFAPSAVLVRRSCFTVVGLFDETLRASEDWDMWLRVAQVYGFAGIDQPLLNYRVHSHNMSADPVYMLHYQTMVVCKHFGPPVGDPTHWPLPRQRAWAAVAYFAAQGYFLRGDDANGQTFLRQSFEANPALTAQVDLFYELGCVEQPLGQRGDPHTLHLQRNAKRLLTALATIFGDTRLAARVQAQRKRAFAHAYLALGLLAYHSHQPQQARRFWFQALCYEPRLAWQHGLITRLAKSLLKPGLQVVGRVLETG